MQIRPVYILMFLMAPVQGIPQAFTETTPGIEGINQGEISWVDYDNDSDLDIFLFGGGQTFNYYAYLYRNDEGAFTKVFPDAFAGLVIGDCDWGDYDNDGDLDLVISGSADSSPGEGVTRIYNNTGDGFSEVHEGEVSPFIGSAVAWGDYDSDGDLDLAIGGEEALTTSNNPRDVEIYQNNNNSFSRVFQKIGSGINLGSVDWGDYDKDGDLDLLMTGFTFGNPEFRTSRIIDNKPTGFVVNEVITLIGVGSGKGMWGDYDRDGDLDIIVNGSTYKNNNLSRTTQIYQNTNGTFLPVFTGALVGTEEGQAAWGDYDEDGDLDVAVIGRPTDNFSGYVSRLYQYNNNAYTFVQNLGTGVRIGSLDWGDYDNDGDLDIIISGQTDTPATITRLYVNNLRSKVFAENQSPSTPVNLNSVIDFHVTLGWDDATDTETSQDGLTYNVYIRHGADTVLSAQSRKNGLRKIIGTGNAGALTTFTLYKPAPGIYHWSVQAIDNSFKGSAFAEEQMFEIPAIVGIETKAEQNQLLIYPNPASDDISLAIRNATTGKVELSLHSMAGQRMYLTTATKETYEFTHIINRNHFPPGVYFLGVSQAGRTVIRKVVFR